MASEAELDELRSVISSWPVVDNHAHNLLVVSELKKEPLESVTTEATGYALGDTFTSLSHIKAAKQLRQLYQCKPDADWKAVLEKRDEWLDNRYDELVRECLNGIQIILMDDGLSGIDTRCHSYTWHDHFTRSSTRRIVRIETLAEQILESLLKEISEEMVPSESSVAVLWANFNHEFENAIMTAIREDSVAGFKSVVCYRTGLDVEHNYNECLLHVEKPFVSYVQRCIKKKEYRLRSKPINDFIVIKTIDLLSIATEPGMSVKPIQFHTGLGDNDMSLRLSNPSHLQPLIERYNNVPFVLLHSAYPFTREAGYLATTYNHVYLDIGEVFPQISRDGQISILRHVLELVPYIKLLWSTDGHFFPETYWLANKQFREALEILLIEYTKKGDLSPSQAIDLTKAIYFENSNTLYNLGLTLPVLESSTMVQSKPDLNTKVASLSLSATPFSPSATAAPFVPKEVYKVADLDAFLKEHETKYFYVSWVDYMGTTRTRIFPAARFIRLVQTGQRIGISKGNVGTLQNDQLTSVVNTTGQLYVELDLSSLRCAPLKDPLAPAATVMCYWRDENGMPAKECPRGGLTNLLQSLKKEFKVSLLVGFEIEVTFLRRQPENIHAPYQPIDSNHAWSTLTTEQYTLALPALAEIVEALDAAGIYVEQFHSESGAGQYEFVLPPLDPIAAIDQLYQARNIIAQIAELRGLRASLHPSPFSGIGTAAHAHVSLNKSNPDDKTPVTANMDGGFWAGVLHHLIAICAFTLPERDSYKRVADNSWTGGTYVAWGTQNRETPLRKTGSTGWEIRCLDGCANMYLALTAVVGAGLLALRKGWGLQELYKDCEFNPARVSEEKRKEYGIVHRMPQSIEAALNALEMDVSLIGILPSGLALDYVAMKREEQKMLSGMSEAGRRIWMIERY